MTFIFLYLISLLGNIFRRINERQTLGDGKTDQVAPVDIYVVGGGVRGSHSEFSSRVRYEKSISLGN